MSLWLLLTALASAGELVVSSIAPAAVVEVDGSALAWVPGTRTAVLAGASGVHVIDVRGRRGATLGALHVHVPRAGVTHVVFDGHQLRATSHDGGEPVVVTPRPRPAPAPPYRPTEIDPDGFAALVRAVDAASFSDDKLAVVEAAAVRHWFTIAQVGQLIDQVTFSDDKVGIVRICHDRVVDPANAFRLAEHFTFSDDREEALAWFQ